MASRAASMRSDVGYPNALSRSAAPGQSKRLLAKQGHFHEATVGSDTSNTHSLDYEVIESTVNQRGLAHLGLDFALEYSAVKWLLVFSIGSSLGLIAFLINMAVENIVGVKLSATVNLLNDDRPWVALLTYSSISVGLITASAFLCAYIAPSAGGSGISEVKAYLNGVDLPNALSVNTLIVKIFGSMLSVAGGLALGKEGPLVHIGACIAILAGSKWTGCCGNFGWRNHFSNDKGKRDLVTLGAGAGVAAAFQCPLAGVLFALEELSSWWKKQLVWKALFTNALGAVVLRVLMSICSGDRCGLYSGGGFVIFDAKRQSDFGIQEVVPAVILGIIGGLLGALFNQIYTNIAKFRAAKIFSKGPAMKVLEAASIALLTAVLKFSLPYFSHCEPCPEGVACPSPELEGKFVQFDCPAGFYNEMAGLAPITNDNAIKNLFSPTPSMFGFYSLSIYLVVFFLLAVITHGCAVPAGLFVPDILIGALYGRMVGMVVLMLRGSASGLDEGTYALLGSASFLSGSMRMTVCLSVMLLEVTGNLLLLPLIMLTATVAKEIGDWFNVGIVDINTELKKLPVLEPLPEPFMAEMTVKESHDGELDCFRAVESVGKIFEILKTTKHSAYPVIEPNSDDGQQGPILIGLVLRSHLKALLEDKSEFQVEDPYTDEFNHLLNVEEPRVEHEPYEFLHANQGRDLKVAELKISEDELGMFINLRPFTNTSAHIITEGSTLRKAYTTFQRLGLSHLCIVSNDVRITGLLTRRDLLTTTFEERGDFDEEDNSLEHRLLRSSHEDD